MRSVSDKNDFPAVRVESCAREYLKARIRAERECVLVLLTTAECACCQFIQSPPRCKPDGLSVLPFIYHVVVADSGPRIGVEKVIELEIYDLLVLHPGCTLEGTYIDVLAATGDIQPVF
jgi:hypothetical protein